jgi:hypothetical protein
MLPLLLALIQAPVDTTVIRVDSSVMATLGQIADTATIEHFRCLLGTTRHDSTFVTAAFEPVVRSASRFSIGTAACPAFITVADWHVHLPIAIRTMTDTSILVDPIPPVSACYLSDKDVETAVLKDSNVVLQVVQVNALIACWWLTVQIQEYVREQRGFRMMWPLRGQRSW